MTKEIRMPNYKEPGDRLAIGIRHSDFGLLSDFVIRHSSFSPCYLPNALSIISACSCLWRRCEPLAGEADAGRVMPVKGRSNKRSPNWIRKLIHAPMFAGSSCTQMIGVHSL